MSDSGKPFGFLPFPGKPPVLWNLWKNSIIVYRMRRECHLQRLQRPAPIPQIEDGNAGAAQQAAPPVAYSDREKNLDLFDCLGAEGQRLFYGTPNSQDYARDPDVVMTVCDGLFREEINVLIATKHFRDRYQKSDETADAFLAELRLLAREANFEQKFVGLETHELRIALIPHCRDKDLQQKLLAEHQTSDLARSEPERSEGERSEAEAPPPDPRWGSAPDPIQEGEQHSCGEATPGFGDY